MQPCCQNKGRGAVSNGGARLKIFLREFRRDEEGGIIIFSLFMFVLMLWFTGMSIDLMRFETTRTKLQGTLDRAVLAAADLDQRLTPCDVVQDYFTKANMLPFLEECIPDEGLNYRVVHAEAQATLPLMFADLPKVFMDPFSPGIESTWSVRGASTAEERVSDVEVSLILDVSSSMTRNNRFNNLVPAAHDFIDTVMANNTNAPEGLITMSIIAYSAVVNTGDDVASQLNLADYHNYSTCPLMPDSEFDSTIFDMDRTYDRVSHFEYSGNNYAPIRNPWCYVDGRNAMIVHSSDTQDLRDMVSDLEPYGNTAIDLGMKWGVSFLDPSTQPIVSHLSSIGEVAAIAADRPLGWEEEDVLKVVVLMTDGENTTEYDLSEPYKSGMSTAWFDLNSSEFDTDVEDGITVLELPMALQNVSRSRISIQYQGTHTPTDYTDDEFVNLSGNPRWTDYPRMVDRDDYRDGDLDVQIAAGNGHGTLYEGDVLHASWQDLYAVWPRNKLHSKLFKKAYDWGAISYSTYVSTYYALDAVVNSSQADNRLSNICEEAREQGIVIYTVAFEAPHNGRAALQDCASSIHHYFDVAGTDITTAFNAIASDIRHLKLTQ